MLVLPRKNGCVKVMAWQGNPTKRTANVLISELSARLLSMLAASLNEMFKKQLQPDECFTLNFGIIALKEDKITVMKVWVEYWWAEGSEFVISIDLHKGRARRIKWINGRTKKLVLVRDGTKERLFNRVLRAINKILASPAYQPPHWGDKKMWNDVHD